MKWFKSIKNWFLDRMAIGTRPKPIKSEEFYPYPRRPQDVRPSEKTIQSSEDRLKEDIATFVEAIGGYCGTLSDRSNKEIEAMAIGFYGVPLTRFYGPTAMDDIDQYSDEFLGKIQKFEALRKYVDEHGGKVWSGPEG